MVFHHYVDSIWIIVRSLPLCVSFNCKQESPAYSEIWLFAPVRLVSLYSCKKKPDLVLISDPINEPHGSMDAPDE